MRRAPIGRPRRRVRGTGARECAVTVTPRDPRYRVVRLLGRLYPDALAVVERVVEALVEPAPGGEA